MEKQNEPVIVEKTYDAPIERVWEAITVKEKMKQWYFDLKEFKAEVGFEFEFEGGDETHTFLHHCKIIEVIPRKKLVHTWRYPAYDGNSTVTWELFQEGDKTRLKLTHTGLDSFPPLPSFVRGNFVQGWTDIVTNLLTAFLQK